MWKEVLTGIAPNLKKQDWDKLGVVVQWLILTRGAVLILTLLSCCIAGLLSARRDYYMGVDAPRSYRTRYGAHPLANGLITYEQSLLWIFVTGLVALLCGVYFIMEVGTLAIQLTCVGAFFLLFYTVPLKYVGAGEVSVFIVWGILMVGGGYSMITGLPFDWTVALLSIPYGLGVTTVIFGKHIDKLEEDRGKKIYTLPVLLGDVNSRTALILLSLLQYSSALVLDLYCIRSFWLLIVLFAVPTSLHCLSLFKQNKPETPEHISDTRLRKVWPNYYVAIAFHHNQIFGSLFVLGLILDVVFGKGGPITCLA
eukprot:TRINITY_DN2918_c0_g2_i4.p1 TRINITY_DN2918_c0_g2~~TRINITY_DN2918_c0_g2_i4.p1  ORF type:complete len:311 (-),score=31.89 TRINITY_DN2918_c0_g2_i4:324-1256(-)